MSSALGDNNRRMSQDVTKLMMSDHKVELAREDRIEVVVVELTGPKDSPYEGGSWRVRVELPDGYPFRSPSIGFVNKVYHPNIDLVSGTVCLDVINQTWSPMFDLVNVFEVFLPQLLLYPNPTDPLNGEAAALLLRDPARYAVRVKEYVRRFAMSGGAEDDCVGQRRAGDGPDQQQQQREQQGERGRPAGLDAGGSSALAAAAAAATATAEGGGGGGDSDDEGAGGDDEAESEGGFLSSSEDEEGDDDDHHVGRGGRG